jgi:serine/threonine-protein kinase
MELLQGEPLSNVEKRERTLPVATACEYTLHILQALEAAHSLGVIHRDLKPDNVFVTFDGGKPVIKLIDFGIAKLKRAEGATGPAAKNLTVAGMLMGTPEYMAPEQAYSAADIDVRADLYSVGVMLYEMLSGQTPAQGEDPRVVVLKVERGEVQPLVHVAPNVPPEIAGLVHRAMAPRPEMRFSSAAEMRIALEAVLSGKRIGTSKLAQATGIIGGTAGAATHTAAHSLAAPAAAAGPAGTGTMMGAPAEGALVPNNHGSGPPPAMAQRPGTGTVRAAPLDARALHAGAAAQGPQHSPYPPPVHGPIPDAPTNPPYRGASHGQRKSGAGLIIALAIVALLLGAGAVVAYVMGTATPAPIAIEPLPTVTALTTPTTPATTATAPPTRTTPVAPLTPPPPQTAPTPPPPRPSGSVAPPRPSGSAAPSNNVPPPFPTFQVPSGFPSAFPVPSGFPTFQVPSGFPPIFPPAPPSPAPGQ